MRRVYFGLRVLAWAVLLCPGIMCGALAVAGAETQAGGAVVVLDPGHGGMDPGAVDEINGILEKTINLAVAQRVQTHLEAAGHRVIVTRGEESVRRWIGLEERAALANRSRADLFISIHANSFHDRSCAGAEIFHHPASVKGRLLAETFACALKGAGPPVKCRVRPSNYYVLRRTRMPAVLVEMGYITNDDEAQLLLAPAYQEKLAAAFSAAVNRYLEGGLTP